LLATKSGWRKIQFLLRDAEIFSFRIEAGDQEQKPVTPEFLHGTAT